MTVPSVSANATPKAFAAGHDEGTNRIRRRRARSRWVLPGVLLVAYFVTDQAIGPLPTSFMRLTVLNAAVLALLLTRLGDPLERTLWVWSGLLVFISGVFLKMFWFAWNLNNPHFINKNYPELRWVNKDTIVTAYPWVTLGFVTWCVACWAALTWSQSSRPRPQRRDKIEMTNATFHLVLIVFLIYAVTSLLQMRVGYGVLGADNPILPGRLGTLVTVFRQNIVPAALLLCLWIFDGRNPGKAKLTTFLIIITGVIDALISTSRGSLPFLVAPVLFLWILTGRLTHQRKVSMLAVGLTAVILFPILSANRYQRISNTPGQRTLPSVGALANAAFFMVTRPTGIEGIWYGVDHRGRFTVSRTLRYLRPRAMTNHYTRSVVRVSRANDNRAPGVIGAFMIIGGPAAVVVLLIGLVLFLQSAWLALFRLESWPVALSLGAPAIAVFVSGGLDIVVFVKLLMQVVACEVIYRKILRRPAQAGLAPALHEARAPLTSTRIQRTQ